MPAVQRQAHCPRCQRYTTLKEVQRHTRDLFPRCTPRQRQVTATEVKLRRRLGLIPNAPPTPPSPRRLNLPIAQPNFHPSRDIHRPVTPPFPIPHSGEDDLDGDGNRRMQLPPPPPTPPPRPPSPFERYMHERAWHPEYAHDTPGAGLEADEDDDEAPTLADAEGYEWLKELTAEEVLGQELEAKIARAGGHKVGPVDLLVAQASNYKLDTNLGAAAFEKLWHDSPSLNNLLSLDRTRTKIVALSGIQGVPVDCCIGSCMAYTGCYAEFNMCIHCEEPRYEANADKNGRLQPRCTFRYIPIIPRLINFFRNAEMTRKLLYRAERPSHPDCLTDIFDGAHYSDLCRRPTT
ncbi:hypothetical protein FRC12_005855 [Ceratobasidium sp. 428]|nr:hypothetical protein FRC12_005855 [Ceratobasidium sp. 428]